MNKLTAVTLQPNMRAVEFDAFLMNPLKTITLKGKNTKLIKSPYMSAKNFNSQFGINTKPLHNLYTNSKMTKTFPNWNKVQPKAITLYVRWK